jgi:hypothetical protein
MYVHTSFFKQIHFDFLATITTKTKQIKDSTFHFILQELNQRLSRLKEQVQELHRDVSMNSSLPLSTVTLQRGSAHSVRAESALREGLFLEDQLERRHAEMERIRKHLEIHWNDNIRHIRIEQEVFQSQVSI